MVMSRGPDERTQMHPMSYLLSTCGCISNRELIDDGAACVVRGNSSGKEPLVSSFLQYAGLDNVRTCKGTRETGLEDSVVAFWKSTRSGLAKPLVWRSALIVSVPVDFHWRGRRIHQEGGHTRSCLL